MAKSTGGSTKRKRIWHGKFSPLNYEATPSNSNPEQVRTAMHTPAIVVGCFPETLSSVSSTYKLTCRFI